MLAEQVGDAVARRGRGHRLLELPAQAAGDDAGHDACGQEQDAAAEMVDQRVLRPLGEGHQWHQPDGEHGLLDGSDRARPHRQPEIEPQRRQQDEHEIEHRRPVAEHRRRLHVVAEHEDDDARQAGLDEGVGEAGGPREVLVLGGAPAQHHDLVQQEWPKAGQRHPGFDAAAEHALGEPGKQGDGAQGGEEQDRQDDGENPHTLDLAAHDLAPERVGIAV